MRGFISFLFFVFFLGSIHAAIENTSVIRTVDVSSQVVRESVTINFQNTQDSPVSHYTVLIQNPENLAFFDVKKKEQDQPLPFKWSADKKSVTVQLSEALLKEVKSTIILSLVYTHVLQPLPKAVGQNEKQKMVYEGNMAYESAYPIGKIKTTFTASTEIIFYTKNDNLVVNGAKLTYGPVTNSPNVVPIRIHYVNNSPFLNVEKLTRILEISHWGNNLAYEESYDTVHAGALLKGQFSRLDYDRYRMNHENTGSINEVRFSLPKGARDVYYRDIIGNISTSHFRNGLTESVLELEPRYPIFGGWRTKWTHGFNVDLSSHLETRRSGEFELEFQFVSPFQNAVIDEYILKVILPEGATDIKFISNFDLGVEQAFETIQTYLDTYGRSILVLSRKNVVNEHNIPVKVAYTYPTVLMLQEPLLLVAFYFVLFIISMIVLRVDFSISKDTGSEKTRFIKKTFETNEEEKKSLFQSISKELENFKDHKNVEKFKAARTNIYSTIESIDKSNKGIYEELKSLSHNSYSRIQEVVHLTRKRLEESTKYQDDIVASIHGKSKGKEQSASNELEKLEKEYNLKVSEALSHEWD